MRTATVVLAMALAAPTMVQTVPAKALSAEDRAALHRIAERGRRLAAYDRMAWLGTDDVRQRLPDWQQKPAGWIVEGPTTSPTLTFDDRSQPPRALYTARLVDGTLIDATLVTGDGAALSPAQLQLIAARQSAASAVDAAGLRPCGPAFNTVVVPPATPGTATSVYFLSAQTKANDHLRLLQIGKHAFLHGVALPCSPMLFDIAILSLPPAGRSAPARNCARV